MAMNERERLARTLQAEAGNQGFGGMMDVGSVIFNRVYSGRFGGNDLNSVIMKPGQFSAWNSETGYADGEQGQDMKSWTPSEESYRAADLLISGNYEDQTGGATHYVNPSISTPTWYDGGDSWTQRGDHVFGNADNRSAGARPPPSMGSEGVPAVDELPTNQTVSEDSEPSILAEFAKSAMQTPQRRPQPAPPPMRRVPFQPVSLVRPRK